MAIQDSSSSLPVSSFAAVVEFCPAILELSNKEAEHTNLINNNSNQGIADATSEDLAIPNLSEIYIKAKAIFFFDLCRCCCRFNVNSKFDSL